MAALLVLAILAKPATAQTEFGTIGPSTDFAVDDGAQRASARPRLVLDIMPGRGNGLLAPRNLLPVGNHLLFSANTLRSAAEPWRTDGTTAGTRLLRNIFPGPNSGIVSAQARFGQGAVFGGWDHTTDCGLWYTNGTPNGTRRVYGSRDNCGVSPAFTPASMFFREFTAVGDALYFSVTLQLWRTDGTATGTGRVRAFDSVPRDLVAMDERTLLFTAGTSEHGIELWRTDGTAAGTQMVIDLRPGVESGVVGNRFEGGFPLLRFGGHVYFVGDDGSTGGELWRTDGTPDGTMRVLDANAGPADGLATSGNRLPSPMVARGGQFFFWANGPTTEGTGSGFELWISDGTAEGSRPVGTPRYCCTAFPALVVSGHMVYFIASTLDRTGLWSSDGTNEGTRMVMDLGKGLNVDSRAQHLSDVDGTLVFAADDGVSGFEPWRSDGTPSGTWRIVDLAPGPASSVPTFPTGTASRLSGKAFVRFGDDVYFGADDGIHGLELWALPLSDINPERPCPGDCDAGGAVTVDELVRGVGIALGTTGIESCATLDSDGDGAVGIDELITAVRAALDGC